MPNVFTCCTRCTAWQNCWHGCRLLVSFSSYHSRFLSCYQQVVSQLKASVQLLLWVSLYLHMEQLNLHGWPNDTVSLQAQADRRPNQLHGITQSDRVQSPWNKSILDCQQQFYYWPRKRLKSSNSVQHTVCTDVVYFQIAHVWLRITLDCLQASN